MSPPGTLRSVRGSASGTLLLSYDTSPDDDMATATLEPNGVTFTMPNRLATLNSSAEETTPTGPDDLNFIVFVSDRAPVAGGASGLGLLWISEFTGGAFAPPVYLPVGNVEPDAGIPIGNPYLVDNHVYFDISNGLRIGELNKAMKKVAPLVDLVGVGKGTHPVVTKNEREIFYQVANGIQRASRGVGSLSFKDQQIVAGSQNDYPTWISDDACQLYAISANHALHIYDRAR